VPVFAPASDQTDVILPEPGKYYVTCTAIEDAPDKGFGPGVKWVFMLEDFNTGEVWAQDLWQFTSTKMGPKAKARPIIEALLGRPLQPREVPDSRELLDKKMIAMVIHEPRDDGSKRAVVTSCVPFAAPTNGHQRPARPMPVAGQGGLLEQVKSAVRKAEILQTPRHLEFLGMDDAALEKMSDSDLYSILQEINVDIQSS
jgi:hypothetical protein